ncbi:uncharacterized protein LOC126151799 [Schistocerca cancellata]|uniref:uncharacterized protein LOC126151799 n=1 Tax=Schistocerca cancellata TaxID=274614 RepID=UPI002119A60D|nr:uncharacterized protein LOC126151799 [Schistocerca cancellata]
MSKKRGAQPELYKRNVIKAARTKGIGYVNHSGREINAVKIGPDCGCKKLCFKRISEHEQIDIFTKFHDFESKNTQDGYLAGLIEKEDVVRRRPRKSDGQPKPRALNYRYHVVTGDAGRVEVCKKAFCSLFGITNERVRRICHCVKNNVRPCDSRGRTASTNATPQEVLPIIEEHIKTFPTKISHYSSK